VLLVHLHVAVPAGGTQSGSVNLTSDRILDVRLGEAHAQMVRLGQLVVVHLDQRQNGLLHGRQLQQRHFAVLPVRARGKVISDRSSKKL